MNLPTRAAHIAIFLLAAAMLAACAPLPAPMQAEAPVPDDARQAALDQATRQQLESQGQPMLRVDPARTRITIVVRRGGTLARLGHDHVIASHTVAGWVAPAPGLAALHFRLDQMTVDETALRAAAGLERQPSPEAIAGTRTNMLTRVLDAERYPTVWLRITRPAGSDTLALAVTLHGVTRQFQVPTHIVSAGVGASLTATGSLTMRQSDFGLVPFAVMGGALAVLDQMELQFDIRAVRASGAAD